MSVNAQLETVLDAADEQLAHSIAQLRFTANRMVATSATCTAVAATLNAVRHEIARARKEGV